MNTIRQLNYSQIEENDSLIAFIKQYTPGLGTSIDSTRNELLESSNKLKKELIYYCGGYDDIHNLKNPDEESLVKEFFIEQGNGEQFKDLINSIIKYTNENGLELTNIARDASEIAIFNDDPYQSNKTFVGVYFGEANLTEALNVMTIMESFVLQAENIYLNRLLMGKIKNGM